MSHSQWPVPHNMSSDLMRADNPLWTQHPTAGDSIMWNGLADEPLTDESMLTNNVLMYSHDARQSTPAKPMAFERSSFWISSGTSNNLGPSLSADVLLSPVSPFSDAKSTFSPGSDNPVTPSRYCTGFANTSSATKMSLSPAFVPSTPQSVIRQLSDSPAERSTFDVPVIPTGQTHAGSTTEQKDDVSMYGSEYTVGQSQSSSPGITQWLPPGYKTGQTAFAHGFQQQHSSTPSFARRPNSFLTSPDCSSRQRQPQWSNKDDLPAQSHFQARFMTPLTDGEKAQRTKDDETLLRMKQDGYTYRDIRKALGRKVAESTLRGRYRSLTKPRRDRLRAPKWTETDISLLKRYVQDEFDRLDVTQPSLENKDKPDKIPWMKIVELIASTGGTYKFGAATAKKKWYEVARPASTRSTRRRSQG